MLWRSVLATALTPTTSLRFLSSRRPSVAACEVSLPAFATPLDMPLRSQRLGSRLERRDSMCPDGSSG